MIVVVSTRQVFVTLFLALKRILTFSSCHSQKTKPVVEKPGTYRVVLLIVQQQQVSSKDKKKKTEKKNRAVRTQTNRSIDMYLERKTRACWSRNALCCESHESKSQNHVTFCSVPCWSRNTLCFESDVSKSQIKSSQVNSPSAAFRGSQARTMMRRLCPLPSYPRPPSTAASGTAPSGAPLPTVEKHTKKIIRYDVESHHHTK